MSCNDVLPRGELLTWLGLDVNVSRAFAANKVRDELVDGELVYFTTHSVKRFVCVAGAVITSPSNTESLDSVAVSSADNVVILEASLINVRGVLLGWRLPAVSRVS